jgi:hypothetical protein
MALAEKDFLYPNPSSGESTLSFYVPDNQFVSVKIFSTNGVLIKELTSQLFSEGQHLLLIEDEKLPQGFYYIQINKKGSRTLLKYIKI